MGCDIHLHVEYKDHYNVWRCGDLFRLIYQTPNGEPEYDIVELYGDRNYALFAILANVRNDGDTKYIDAPRGLPDDVSDIVRRNYEDWGMDAHSCSYFTLQELIDFHDEGHPLRRSGVLSPEQLKDLDEGILPDNWCQGTNREGHERREWEEENNILVPLIDRLKRRMSELYLTYDFMWDSQNPGSRKEAYEKSADIRIVFWFDN